MKKLRIAFFVTSEMPFPIPKEYNRPFAPLMIALDLAEELGKRGHEIVFFGPQGSKSSKYIQAHPTSLIPLYKNNAFADVPLLDEGKARIQLISDTYIIQELFRAHSQKPFDIIHIYSPASALPIAKNFLDTKIVYTLQNIIFPWERASYLAFASPNHYFVNCSNNQKTTAPDINSVATIYNGVNTKLFQYSATHDDYLLFVGRTHPKKGLQEAIRVAQTLDKKLIIIGSPITEIHWWNKEIKPFLGGKIEYLGYKEHKDLSQYFQKAEAFLMPILWEEPFGRVMVEAMSCGTPVVAFNRGAVSEIVKNGETGFIVEDVKGMIGAVKNINSIERKNCREWVEEKFDLNIITTEYENLFYKITQKN